MQQMTIDIEHGCAIVASIDNVRLPEFIVERLSHIRVQK